MILDDHRCGNCGHQDEFFHRRGSNTRACPECSTAVSSGVMRRVMPRLQQVEDFGSLGKHYARGVTISKGQREERDHWVRSRFGEKAPKDPNPRPVHFLPGA